MNSKDIERPILNIVENDETCTLSISVHKENQSEDEIRMVNDAIEKLLDLLPVEQCKENSLFTALISTRWDRSELEKIFLDDLIDDLIDDINEHEKCNKDKKQSHQFKIGDRVRFKTWEQLREELGSHRGCMVNGMKHLCGTYATITKIKGDMVELTDFSTQENGDWIYFADMIEPSPYYCGKVVCVDDKGGAFTKGKVYTVKDGTIEGDTDTFYNIKSLKNMNETMESKFIEVKNE